MYGILQLKEYNSLHKYKLKKSIQKFYKTNTISFFNSLFTLLSDTKLEYKTFNKFA